MDVIKWAWRHHVLDADTFDSVKDAVLAAEYAADQGDEALECIEVIQSGVSRLLTPEEYDAIVDPINQAQEQAYRNAPRSVVVLRLAAPNGKDWATYQGFADPQIAEATADEFRARIGSHRVKVQPAR